jgi:hypothetical protein
VATGRLRQTLVGWQGIRGGASASPAAVLAAADEAGPAPNLNAGAVDGATAEAAAVAAVV